MVKKLLLICLILISNAKAASFTASVNSDNIAFNKTILLTLALTDAQLKSDKGFAKIEQDFDIKSISHSSIFQMINMKSSSTKEWKFVLKPKKTGKLLIPTLNIETNEGVLTSKKILITVDKKQPIENTLKDGNIFVGTVISRPKPYLYEPFLFTVKLYTQYNAHDIHFSPLEIKGILIKPINSPHVVMQKYKGEGINVIEMSYLITPLDSQPIHIPPIEISGIYSSVRNNNIPNTLFGPSLFYQNYDLDTSSDKFILQTDSTVIEVLPAVQGILPWLPAQSLSLTEELAETEYEVGKSFNRKIIITAEGLKGNQLPNNVIQNNHHDYKLYKETPQITEDISKERIISTKIESYTVVPKKSGNLTLPAIEIKWWDVNTKKLMTASLPNKTIQVKAGQTKLSKTINNTIQKPALLKEQNHNFKIVLINIIFYGTLIVLLSYITFKIVKIICKPNKKNKNNTKQLQKKTVIHRTLEQNYDSINSAKDLYDYLKDYAHMNFNTRKNSSLNTIFSLIRDYQKNYSQTTLDNLQRSLGAALYNNQDLDINYVKNQLKIVLKSLNPKIPKNSTKKKKLSKLTALNPTDE